MSSSRPEGWRGWDEYAAFYDWENQRTLGRRDVAFWVQVADKIRGRVLELGCGTGRVALPLVRSDRRRGLTTFGQCYVERRGRSAVRHRFDLTFRTLPIESMRARLEGAGFSIEAVLGDYRGGAWDQRADVWIILARKVGPPV